MQIDMAESAFCQEHVALCTSAIHTYTQTVTITSPSGRTGSCTFSSKYPAIDTEDLQCEATLAIDGESGTYSFADNQQAVCTISGRFSGSEHHRDDPGDHPDRIPQPYLVLRDR
jgi:hypothetical protein